MMLGAEAPGEGRGGRAGGSCQPDQKAGLGLCCFKAAAEADRSLWNRNRNEIVVRSSTPALSSSVGEARAHPRVPHPADVEGSPG